MASHIAQFRDNNGPFRTPFDLYRVDWVQRTVAWIMSNGTPGGRPTPTGPADGRITDATGAANDDFENQYLFLTRISNMITTRSDTFTCYLLVEGWRNVGTAAPQRVAQRRVGFILDRTGVTPPAARTPPDPLIQMGLKMTIFPND